MSEQEKMTALVQLAGGVAHELNNIFTAVMGNLSLLDESGLDDEQSSATIRDVVRSAQRGIALSAKLQAFAGHQALKRERIDLHRLIVATLRPLQSTLLMRVDLRMHLADGDCHVFADADRLAETISEIANNAQAAMPNGGQLLVETSVHDGARTQQSRPYVRIAISDSGTGMPPEVAARALDPLFTTKHKHINAGWGLSNCVGFVRQSGGQITIASTPGQGTRVDIFLPLQIAAAAVASR
jgi:signal transduction histidine kinase